MRELLLLGVQIFERADGIALGVVGDKVALVEVRADSLRRTGGLAVVHADIIAAVRALHRFDTAAEHGAVDLVARLDVSGDGGLRGIDGMIVVQKRRGRDDGIGEVMLRRHAKLLERAEHAVRLDAA